MLWIIKDDESAVDLLTELANIKEQTGESDLAVVIYCILGEDVLLEKCNSYSLSEYDAVNSILLKCDFLGENYSFAEVQRYTFGMAALDKEHYDSAAHAFKDAGEYSDAAIKWKDSIYLEGVLLLEERDFDGAIAMFNTLGDYKDAANQVLESQYQKADALNSTGEYGKAYETYTSIAEYKDVDSILENDINMIREKYKEGNTVVFGSYGQKAIEWIVLKNDGNTAMMISKDVLSCKPYNTENRKGVTWQSCTLRAWLNGDFLKEAFSSDEQKRLESVTVKAEKNSRYNTDPGNDTVDKVFLLSINEAREYFDNDSERQSNKGYPWWLRTRTSDDYHHNSAYVQKDGSININGANISSFRDYYVRPVVVVKLAQ